MFHSEQPLEKCVHTGHLRAVIFSRETKTHGGHLPDPKQADCSLCQGAVELTGLITLGDTQSQMLLLKAGAATGP